MICAEKILNQSKQEVKNLRETVATYMLHLPETKQGSMLKIGGSPSVRKIR
jgi:hypothetical protein